MTVARKIACYYYRTITKGEMFVEQGIKQYEEALKERQRQYLQRMANKLNMALVTL